MPILRRPRCASASLPRWGGRRSPGACWQARRGCAPLIRSFWRRRAPLFPCCCWRPSCGGGAGERAWRSPEPISYAVWCWACWVWASNYLYYFAIEKTSVAVAIILQYTAPVWVLLYMVGRGRQSATTQRVSSVALAVAGSALAIGAVGGGGLHLDGWGVAAALVAAFAFAFYNVGGHDLLTRHDHWRILTYVLLGAALFWLAVNPPWKIAAARYSSGEWLFLLLFAVVSVLVPYLFYFAGLRHLDATRAIVTSCLEPVFSIVIAALALGELVRPVQVAGIALVLLATVLVQLPSATDAESAILEPIE